jgi:hypothetical protein
VTPRCTGGDMKYTFRLLLAALALHAQVAAGDDSKCLADYRLAVRACVRSLDFLIPGVRTGAQRACVEGAVLTKAYCMSGTDACLDTCQAAYEDSVAACEETFAPATCAGGVTCEAIILQERDNCISHAVGVLDSCSAVCPM